jgi:hypothetical protein
MVEDRFCDSAEELAPGHLSCVEVHARLLHVVVQHLLTVGSTVERVWVSVDSPPGDEGGSLTKKEIDSVV